MKILFFHSTENVSTVKNLISSIENRLFPDKSVFCSNITVLKNELNKFGHRPDVAVLFVSNSEELKNLIEMKDLFFDVFLLVVIPDESRENINLGHKLHPRFLTTKNGDISILTEILLNIKKRINGFQNIGSG